jgi:hypothetical protein
LAKTSALQKGNVLEVFALPEQIAQFVNICSEINSFEPLAAFSP